MKKIIALSLAVVMLFTMSAVAVADTADGVYTGKGVGMGEITVELTVKDGMITEATVIGDGETPGLGAAHLDELAEQIIAAQGADIDGVAGCTITSNGTRDAVLAALGGAEEVEAVLADGVYHAEAYGFHMGWSDKIDVTIENGEIAAIAFGEDNGDTPPMMATVEKTLFPRIIDAQSVAVDGATGATATSGAVKTAVEDCLKQALVAAGCDESAISAFKVIPEKNSDTEEISTQILVIGMGGSGTYAALRAAENGADVLVIEKQSRYGGTTALTSEIESINPPRIKDIFNDGNDFCDAEDMRQAWGEYVMGDGKDEMIDLFFEQSGPALDWLAIDHGVLFDFVAKVGFTESDIYPVKFQWYPNTTPTNPMFGANKVWIARFFDMLVNDYTALGGQYMLDTEGYELLIEDGVIVGAKARNLITGTEYIIHADAVILAEGGFIGNGEMTTKYLSDEYFPLKGEWKVYGSLKNDGKMLQQAIDNGAATYNMGMPPEVHLSGSYAFIPATAGFPITEVPGMKGAFSGVQMVWSVADLPMYLGITPDSLAVDKNGSRFTSETGIGMLDPWIAGPNYYSIWSEDRIESIRDNGLEEQVSGPSTGFLGYLGAIPAGVALPEAFDVLDYAMNMGFVFKADTIAELAEMIGADPATLEATVEAYNGYCETGVDEQFGKPAGLLKKVGDGPYYAVKMASYSYGTVGALDINEQFQVLDTEGNVMEGLYAIGGDSMGVLFSERKPYVTYGGANNGWALTSGYVAGEIVAKNVLAD